jgi:leucine-zipper-like transcriptional regulator 1
MYFLDTDPVPEPQVSSPSCLQLVVSDLRQFLDRPADASGDNGGGGFSDVTLVVEGQPIRAHRLVLSIASERFRAMFDRSLGFGFRESQQREIEIKDCGHEAYRLMLEYIYSGETPAPLRMGGRAE